MLDFLGNLVKHFLPDENDKVPEYVAKVAALIIMGGLTLWAIRGTAIGDRIGINPLPPKEITIPTLTLREQRDRQQKRWEQLAWLRAENEDISGAFIIGFIDEKTNNLIAKADYGKYTKSLIISHSIQLRKWDSLDIIRNGFDVFLLQSIEQMNKSFDSNGCIGGRMPSELLNYFRKGVTDFQSTHAVACPLYGIAKTGDRYIIAATMAIYKPSDGKNSQRIESMLRTITNNLGNSLSLTQEYRYYEY